MATFSKQAYAAQMALRRAARIILIGAPGVGKGTHTERLLNRYPQLSSVSSGDILRENVRNKTPLGTSRAVAFPQAITAHKESS